MTASELRRGIEIITSYFKDDEQMPTSCEHDELWLGADVLSMSPEHAKELRELGFRHGCMGWSAFL